jgi:hypothetical protein
MGRAGGVGVEEVVCKIAQAHFRIFNVSRITYLKLVKFTCTTSVRLKISGSSPTLIADTPSDWCLEDFCLHRSPFN